MSLKMQLISWQTHLQQFFVEDPIKPAPYQIYDGEMQMLVDKVYAALQSLNAGLAVGPDKVHLWVLKAWDSNI